MLYSFGWIFSRSILVKDLQHPDGGPVIRIVFKIIDDVSAGRLHASSGRISRSKRITASPSSTLSSAIDMTAML
jgi:hypothetical protein